MLSSSQNVLTYLHLGGAGYGSATVIGSGTVYPAALGGLIGFTSSGTVEGRGSVVGCGTIVSLLCRPSMPLLSCPLPLPFFLSLSRTSSKT